MRTQPLNLHLGGGNTGATAITRHLLRYPERLRGAHITGTDRKPDRAQRTMALLDGTGAHTRAFTGRCEEIIPTLDPQLPAVLAIDEIAPMAQLMDRQHNQVVLAQGVGRSPAVARGVPGPAVGLSFAGVPERPEERQRTARCLRSLAALAPNQSSTAIKADLINAQRTTRAREEVSAQTVTRVKDLDRTREAEVLNALFWDGVNYPLVVAEREMPLRGTGKEQALDLAADFDQVAVLLFSEAPAIVRADLFVLHPKTRQGGHFTKLYIPFGEVEPPRTPTRRPADIIDVEAEVISSTPTRSAPTSTGSVAAFTD